MSEEIIDIDGEPHVRTPAAATRLGVSVRRVLDFINDNRLPSRKIGSDHYIKLSDLEAFKILKRKAGRPATKKSPGGKTKKK